MTVPVVLAKGCSLDDRYNGCHATATHLDLQYIRSDAQIQPLNCLPRTYGALRRGSHELNPIYPLSRPGKNASTHSTLSHMSAAGTQMKLSSSASRRKSLRGESAQSMCSATIDVKSLTALTPDHNKTTSCKCPGLDGIDSQKYILEDAPRLRSEQESFHDLPSHDLKSPDEGDFTEHVVSTESITGKQ